MLKEVTASFFLIEEIFNPIFLIFSELDRFSFYSDITRLSD